MTELVAGGADPDAADDVGRTALHNAATITGDAARRCLGVLLDAGVDVDEDTFKKVLP